MRREQQPVVAHFASSRCLAGKSFILCFCLINYPATVACICMQLWQNRLLVWASNLVGFVVFNWINRDAWVFEKKYKKYFFVCCIRPISLHVLEHFFMYKKYWKFLKMCFRMDFLNTKKIIFLHFWILQHVCKTPKGIGQYSKKYTKILFLGNSSIIHR